MTYQSLEATRSESNHNRYVTLDTALRSAMHAMRDFVAKASVSSRYSDDDKRTKDNLPEADQLSQMLLHTEFVATRKMVLDTRLRLACLLGSKQPYETLVKILERKIESDVESSDRAMARGMLARLHTLATFLQDPLAERDSLETRDLIAEFCDLLDSVEHHIEEAQRQTEKMREAMESLTKPIVQSKLGKLGS